MKFLFAALVAGLAIVASAHWVAGLYLCLILDVVRDPLRKLEATQSIIITVMPSLIWLGVFAGVLQSQGAEMRSAFSRYPQLRTVLALIIAALLPAALFSCLLYERGYLLAMIGGASYLAPWLAVGIGFVFIRSERAMMRFLAFYCIVNAIALIGTPLEYYGFDSKIFGGIKMDWKRFQDDYVVNLIAGIYRSPDIMGLHAAHVAMFSLILAGSRQSKARWAWVLIFGFAMFCLLLSGRRKMIGIPMVFVASYLFLGMWRGMKNFSKRLVIVAAAAVACAGAMFVAQEVDLSSEYTDFATTLFTNGAQRSSDIIGGSVVETVMQSGVMGSGLGSATQGKQYTGIEVKKAWQEDGASRLFKELGIPGVLFMSLAMLACLGVLRHSLTLIHPWHPAQGLQISLLSVVIGNVASFLISHQQYSGDPMTCMLVLFLVGAVLGAPRLPYVATSRAMAPKPLPAPGRLIPAGQRAG